MKKMQSAQLGLCLVVLTAASCGFSRPPNLADGGDGKDSVTSDGGPIPLSLELLAGNLDGPGNVDGTGIAARFYAPTGVAVDSAGSLYVADTNNDIIRKITGAGDVTTLAGIAGMSGSADGTGTAARFYNPTGVAVDSAGNLYVADQRNHIIRKVTTAGVVTTLAGTVGVVGSADGTGDTASFSNPAGVAVDSAGNVYVADQGNSTIRKVTAVGVVTTLVGTAGVVGSADGTGAAARFNAPRGVAVDSAGDVYVADTNNHTVRKVTAAGVVTTLAGTAGTAGSANGTGTAARFNLPCGVAVDSVGNLYVGDVNNHTIRKVTAAGGVTTLAGIAGTFGSADGMGAAARFFSPFGVVVDSAGSLYVADSNNSNIRKVTAAGVVTTLAGTSRKFVSADGTGAAARFNAPIGVTVDSAGNIYVADGFNDTIRKIATGGVVTTLAGTAGVPGSVDDTGAAARFSNPFGVAVDSAGNIYVADVSNNTIRKVTAAGVVTTLAGTAGMRGSADGIGVAAHFNFPAGVAADRTGNVYVADENNHIVRKIIAGGVVTTLAGTASEQGSSDGVGSAARFCLPTDVAVDSAESVYVADRCNHTIRKVTADGVVTTLAGTAGMRGSTDGTGAAARFNDPGGVAVDGTGNVYVADQGNSIIRKITPDGTTTTLAGMVSMASILLGGSPRFAFPERLVIVGDSIILSDTDAILLLHHGAQ